MIKFFRKIRQKLLSENRFRKYLLYAVGEIVLVVIGILIALQINNWNQNKVTRKKEISIIKKLANKVYKLWLGLSTLGKSYGFPKAGYYQERSGPRHATAHIHKRCNTFDQTNAN
ncbi:DUF6090 family protein [Algibacter sp. 2305UL17-15]|uniref:DUF6090 family protein n=1 Tax=Algibacter sp. 2305UL17-15 TaxID=3231268 RepID=UPI00345ADB63